MALRKWTGNENIQAVGVIDSCNSDYFVYSPMERFTKTSKIPIQTEFLTNVKGRVYILKTEGLNLPNKFKIFLGALISKGFGQCELIKKREIINAKIENGILNTRIPYKYQDVFLIDEIKPVYGYLFEPTSKTTGFYIKSLFEGSEVKGPTFLLGGQKWKMK